MIEELGYKYYSSNKVLNVIINDKVQNAELKNISVQCEIKDVCLDFIKDIDLTIIISNLLDNTIEAAKKVENDSYIRLKINLVDDYVEVDLTNSNKISPNKIKKGIFKYYRESNKGLGGLSVRKALEKYDGRIRLYCYENIFRVNILIPKKDKINKVLEPHEYKGEIE